MTCLPLLIKKNASLQRGRHDFEKVIDESLRIGRPKPIVDSQIAATALSHGMTLVTRNVTDMADFGVEIVNPFS